MAGRDYASRHRRPSGRKKSSGLPGWVWLFVGLSVGLAVAVFIYISRPPQTPLRGTSAAMEVGEPEPAAELVNGKRIQPKEARDIGERPKARPESAAKGERIEVPPKEKSRFTFYELLPNQEVLVPSQPATKGAKPGAAAAASPSTGTAPAPAPATAATPPAGGGSFIIQVASYKSQSEAERQKAALALLGIESRIENVTIDNRDTYYRVRIGPIRDEARARDTLAQLESNGINGMLVKLK